MWDHSQTQTSSLYVSKTALDEALLPIYPLGLLPPEGEVLVEGKSRAGRGQGA
jgi:hypothetical protein